jgi:hypothetical protein
MAFLYLAESEDSISPWRAGSDQSPTVRTTDTLRLFCFHECRMGACHELLSGTTCSRYHRKLLSPSTSTSSTAASPARISALQELERAWMDSGRDYSSKSSGWLAGFDRNSFSWKTSQLSLFGGSTEFFWRSLRWGSIVGGLLFQPAKWEPATCERDGGWVPTPTARDFKSPGVSRQRKANIEQRRGIPLSLWFKETFGRNLHPNFVEWMMGYPPKHTACADWAMQWFRKRRGKRSGG